MPLGKRIGFIPRRVDEGLLIDMIDAASNAAKAGLMKGDIIVEFGGINADSLRIFGLKEIILSGTEKIPVTYIRDGKEQTTIICNGTAEL